MSKLVKKLEIEALRKRLGDTDNFIIIEPLAPDAAADYNFRTEVERAEHSSPRCQELLRSLASSPRRGFEADVWTGTDDALLGRAER